jgi:hypothetical protein
MNNHGIRVEAERIVIRNRGVATIQILSGLLQLVLIVFLFNIRFDTAVLIVVGVVVGGPKLAWWVCRWRRRMEFDLAGITIVNFWKQHRIAWARVAKVSLGATDAGISRSPALRPQLIVHEIGIPVGTRSSASVSVGPRRRRRLADVLRSNPVLFRRPADEVAAIVGELLDWDNQYMVVAASNRIVLHDSAVSDQPVTGPARHRFAGVMLLVVLGAVLFGSMWYLMNPLFHHLATERTSDPVDIGGLLDRLTGPCDGELAAPAPLLLSSPLETLALRRDGHDVWKVHAKFQTAWNFAQHVSLKAIDSAPGYVHDTPGSFGLELLGGQDLTLVIGDGIREVEMPCDNP